MDTTPTGAPETQTPFPANPNPRSGNIGALAAAVIIVILLAAGGFYFFTMQQEQQAKQDAQVQQAGETNATPTTATNDSLDSIETDLNATQTSGSEQDVSSLNSAL